LDQNEAMTNSLRGTHGKEMKSIEGWLNSGGTNTSGLNILPSGWGLLISSSQAVSFAGIGGSTELWTSSSYSSDRSWIRTFKTNIDGVFRDTNYISYNTGLSNESMLLGPCRCIQQN